MNSTAFVIGDSYVASSGLTYMAKNMHRILTEMGYNVVYLSCSGQQHEPVNNALYMGNSLKKFDEYVEKYRPSLVVSVHDPWMLLYTLMSAYRHTFTYVAYAPVEANYYPQQVVYNLPDDQKVQPIPIGRVYQECDYVIAYNEFGAQGLKAMGVKPRAAIHNGMDRNKTYRVSDPDVIKQRRAVIGVDDDTVLFMHMGRNSTRKRQDVMLQAWQKFMKLGQEKLGHKPKAKLYVHSDRYSFNGLDIPSIITRLGINDSVIMPTNIDFSDEDLNLFYNASDVYVGLPSGEGHGLGFAEAMAVGKPLIYGSYGGHTTFCKGAGIEVPPVAFISAQNIDAPRAIISERKAAEAMLELYLDKNKREEYGQVGLKLSEELYWDKLDDRFKACFAEAVKEGNRSTIFAKKVV